MEQKLLSSDQNINDITRVGKKFQIFYKSWKETPNKQDTISQLKVNNFDFKFATLDEAFFIEG